MILVKDEDEEGMVISFGGYNVRIKVEK